MSKITFSLNVLFAFRDHYYCSFHSASSSDYQENRQSMEFSPWDASLYIRHLCFFSLIQSFIFDILVGRAYLPSQLFYIFSSLEMYLHKFSFLWMVVTKLKSFIISSGHQGRHDYGSIESEGASEVKIIINSY